MSSLHVLYILKALRKKKEKSLYFSNCPFFIKFQNGGKGGSGAACAVISKGGRSSIATFEDFPFPHSMLLEDFFEAHNLCVLSAHHFTFPLCELYKALSF